MERKTKDRAAGLAADAPHAPMRADEIDRQDDLSYYRRRIAVVREQAAQAKCPSARSSYEELGRLYAEKLDAGEAAAVRSLALRQPHLEARGAGPERERVSVPRADIG
ncbi:MAG: hypothetical protein WDN24_04930 [Sphingomonas sp.]